MLRRRVGAAPAAACSTTRAATNSGSATTCSARLPALDAAARATFHSVDLDAVRGPRRCAAPAGRCAGARPAARPGAARARHCLRARSARRRARRRLVAGRVEAVAAGEVVEAGPGRDLRRRRRRSRRGSSSRGTSAGAASSRPCAVQPVREGHARRAQRARRARRARAVGIAKRAARRSASTARGEAAVLRQRRRCADALHGGSRPSCHCAVEEQPLLRAVAQVALVVDRSGRPRGGAGPVPRAGPAPRAPRRRAPAGSARRAGRRCRRCGAPRLLPPAASSSSSSCEVLDAGQPQRARRRQAGDAAAGDQHARARARRRRGSAPRGASRSAWPRAMSAPVKPPSIARRRARSRASASARGRGAPAARARVSITGAPCPTPARRSCTSTWFDSRFDLGRHARHVGRKVEQRAAAPASVRKRRPSGSASGRRHGRRLAMMKPHSPKLGTCAW